MSKVNFKLNIGDVSQEISGSVLDVYSLYTRLYEYEKAQDVEHQELLSKVKNLNEALNTAGRKITELSNGGANKNVKEK